MSILEVLVDVVCLVCHMPLIGGGHTQGCAALGVNSEWTTWRMIWLTMKPMGRERERGVVVARL